MLLLLLKALNLWKSWNKRRERSHKLSLYVIRWHSLFKHITWKALLTRTFISTMSFMTTGQKIINWGLAVHPPMTTKTLYRTQLWNRNSLWTSFSLDSYFKRYFGLLIRKARIKTFAPTCLPLSHPNWSPWRALWLRLLDRTLPWKMSSRPCKTWWILGKHYT